MMSSIAALLLLLSLFMASLSLQVVSLSPSTLIHSQAAWQAITERRIKGLPSSPSSSSTSFSLSSTLQEQQQKRPSSTQRNLFRIVNDNDDASRNLPPSTTMTDLQNQLQIRTLLRITIPSLASALICFLTFPTVTNTIFTYVQTSFDGVETGTGYEALNLLLTDNSNQFVQNAHNFLSLNFCFLTSFTFSFLYNNQVKLYNALFEEVSVLFSLIEQAALSSEGRDGVYKSILLSIRRYVNEDLKIVTNISTTVNVNDINTAISGGGNKIGSESDNGGGASNVATNSATSSPPPLRIAREDVPSFLVSQRPQNDPLETILYLTSVGKPSYIYSTVRSLRQARSNRLASLQRKMPEINMYLLYTLGFTAWVTFPIVTAGSSTVGGDALIELYRNQLSLGLVGMGLVLGVINELKQPEVGSAYNVDFSVLGTLIDGLDRELDNRLSRCDAGVGSGGSNINSSAAFTFEDTVAVDNNSPPFQSGRATSLTTKSTRRPGRQFLKKLRDRTLRRIRTRKQVGKNNDDGEDDDSRQLFKL